MIKVIGQGLLGSAFSVEALNNTVYFCSGVANSHEDRESEFDREKDLFFRVANEVSLADSFVYFSSVLAPKRSNRYFNHKMEMEELVRSTFPKSHYIMRLPQVVGMSSGSNLFPELVRKLINNFPITIYSNAYRSLVDVDDVVRVTNSIVKTGVGEVTVDLCSNNNVLVSDLVDLISEELGVGANKIYVDAGEPQHCSARLLSPFLENDDVLFDPDYASLVVRKYALSVSQLCRV